MPDPTSDDNAINRVRSWIHEADQISLLTGAGISTDSGIPDFRGPKGVWTRNPEAEKMATLQNYMSDPDVRKLAWQARLKGAEVGAKPNPGHIALVELERLGKLHTLITQNVDGLHLEAGHAPDKIVEIHGSMREVVCMECDERAPMERALARVRKGEEDPECRSCGGVLKSATISFGQGLVSNDLMRAQAGAENCDLMLAIGSTLSVYPVAGVVPLAKQSGARIVIINAESTEMDELADEVIRGSISEVLSKLTRVEA